MVSTEVVTSVLEALSGVSAEDMVETITTIVDSQLSTVETDADGNDNVTDYDIDTLKAILESLNSRKKAFSKLAKDNESAAKKEAKAAAEAEARESLIGTLSEGDKVAWYFAKQKRVVTGTVAKQKDGAKRLHVILDAEYADGETKLDKYIEFAKVQPVAAEAVA